MAGQLPTAAEVYSPLPLLPIRVESLVDFSEQMDRRLAEFDQRFVIPRTHPRLELGSARTSKPKRRRRPK